MKKQLIIAFIAFTGLATSLIAQAQTAATVKVSGEVTTPLSLSLSDLHQYTQTTVVRKDKDGKDHTYSGVILADILQKAGVIMNRESLTKYLLVNASDGYEIIFALAELDKSFTDRAIILADTVDGKPLPQGDGPFRIIVQDEKKPARCIKQVTSLKVLFAK
ncbi:molybdopterin-binding protein [Mucilaginibacter sp. PPCGB 2223]|uniref:molybdopterin-dependent oxidoreductase n=1 Tax=Mucilaginibacter sp. PPCGB 2223 TaxID=1886027 RepID=UPI000826D3F5|nr:molybdopterin-dependent oxidoreductase [Mucilaginibacter sp. PPCGB 2223]OCX53570.1 molybdopterin-binding protein [Mucilaginibacter sp. PPCGB 2223]